MVGPFVGTYDEFEIIGRGRKAFRYLCSSLRYKQAIYRGEILEGYFVLEDGRILSNKQNSLKELRYHIGYDQVAHEYPHLAVRINGKSKTAYVHRIVCETYVSRLFIPEGVPIKDWNDTPESVKALVHQNMYVNHIDHDKSNFHPSNLEWVTAKQNAEKYQEHKRAA